MNAHLFRHAIAEIYVDADPGGHEFVRRVLGTVRSIPLLPIRPGPEPPRPSVIGRWLQWLEPQGPLDPTNSPGGG